MRRLRAHQQLCRRRTRLPPLSRPLALAACGPRLEKFYHRQVRTRKKGGGFRGVVSELLVPEPTAGARCLRAAAHSGACTRLQEPTVIRCAICVCSAGLWREKQEIRGACLLNVAALLSYQIRDWLRKHHFVRKALIICLPHHDVASPDCTAPDDCITVDWRIV